MNKILLPIDGSIECQKALDYTIDMAEKYGSKITIIHVLDYNRIPNAINYDEFYDKIYNIDSRNEMLQKAVEYFEEKGIEADAKLVKGDPESEIIDEAEKEGYDICIMCTHGMSSGKRFMLGSVTNKVVRYIGIPILVIR